MAYYSREEMEDYTGTITSREEVEDLINFWDMCYFYSEAKTIELEDEDGYSANYRVDGEALDFLFCCNFIFHVNRENGKENN